MNFLSKLLQGIAFVPAVVHGIEGLFGGRSGVDKKQAVLSFVSASVSLTDAVANKIRTNFREVCRKLSTEPWTA